MISDFQLLGIEETSDRALIKSAYRKRMKELHPDTAEGAESFGRHALLVGINQAYRRLLKQSETKPVRSIVSPQAKKGNELTAHADPAYAFYKAGMSYYMKIHPSEWDFEKSGMLNIKISEDDMDQELMRRKIQDLIKLFPKAYYYFSIVAHEYSESIWVMDSREKMTLIEKMTQRYKKIIESFSVWNTDKKVHVKKYMEQYNKHKETHQKMDGETEERWKS